MARLFQKRRIPLSSIRQISFDFPHARKKGGGDRYFVIIWTKGWHYDHVLLMGKSKTNDALLEQLPKLWSGIRLRFPKSNLKKQYL